MTKEQAITIVQTLDRYEAELRGIEVGLHGLRMKLVAEHRIGRNEAGLDPEDRNVWQRVAPEPPANPEPGGGSGDLVALANEMLQQLKTCRVNESVTAAFQQRLLAWAESETP